MSADQNNINLTGRCVRDAESRTTKSGEAICNVAIAVNGYRKDDETTFFDLVFFGKKAAVAQYLVKGTRVALNGRLRQRKFTRKDGSEGVALEVAVNDLSFMSPRDGGGGTMRDTSDGPLIEHKRGAKPGAGWSSDPSNDTDDIPF
jgi:single-strand DNA-binding protein